MIIEKLKSERNIPEQRIVSYRFDSMLYEDMTAKELYRDISGKLSYDSKTYLFLDEIQEIDGWERVVNSLASDFDVDIFVTGSNSRMMSSEISTYLTGRYVSFRIYTLSFEEYLEFTSSYRKVDNLKAEVQRYIRLGGFPATHIQDISDTVASSLENVVYLELCRRGYTVNVGKFGTGEIDFIATRQNEKVYVQVTQEINSEKTEKREYERLLAIRDNYPKYVLTANDFAGGNYEGIKTMHIADFLLLEEWA